MDCSFVTFITVTGSAGSTGGGLLGRLARLVVTSLVVSSGGGWAHGELCGKDEFYDAVVERCALCRDVCNLCLRPESNSFCSRNCPEYYAKMQASNTGCPHTKQSPSSRVSAKEYKEAENHPRTSSSTLSSSSSSSTWSTNPLMVTTIVALSIAVVATLVILPLVLCVQVRQRCTDKPSTGAPGARPQSASPAAYNAMETGTKLPSTPIYNPPNGLKEKSDPLLMSGVC